MALTEQEIFDCLKTNLQGAADDCDMIARHPQSGLAFQRMRSRLALAEGACKQAAFWREDARWLRIGLVIETAHQKARQWLDPATVSTKKMFTTLASALRQMLLDLKRLETGATGRTGMILPKAQALPFANRRSFIQVPPSAVLQ